MAYAKKTAKNEAYQKLKTDLKEGNPLGNAYLFYGEESYLREYYLGEIRKRLIPAGFEEFNYHALEGKDLTAQSLTEMAEAMPMMAERTLIVVTDWDIYKLNEDQRERFIALLEDLPEYCCIVFVYDTVAYKQNKTVKKLCKAMDAHVTPIEFKAQDTSDLTAWIARRFRALGKQIDRQTAEYLIFLCGGLMTGLSQEIAKIGAYAKGEVITQRDIDAVADPVLSAEIFKMTDAVSQSDYNKAAAILGDLLKMQEEPIVILAALGSQLRRLYTARMAIDSGKDKYWLMELWEMRSDYPAKLLLQSAKRVSAQWCGDAVKMCQVADLRMKSQRGPGRGTEAAAGPVRSGPEMRKIKEVIVVEGRYDKNTLAQVVDATVVTLGGFSVFNDKEKVAFLRRLAAERGLIVLTDSDGAGFVIRNYLKGALPKEKVKQAYIPDIHGKEKRKRAPGKEGKLGVEGMKPEVILEALRRAGATFLDEMAELAAEKTPITKADLMEWGLAGGAGSSQRRQALLRRLDLPEHLTANGMLEALNLLTDREELAELLQDQ